MANVADGATGTVLTAPSPATSGTSITLNPGEGYRFPAVPFFAVTHANNTIPTVSTSEKVQVTAQGQTTIAAGSNGAALPQGTVNVVDATSLNASGSVTIITSNGAQVVAYTGKTGTTLTGCTGGTGTMSTGGAVVGDNFTIVRGISPYNAQTVLATWRFSNAIFASDLNNASIVRNEVPVGAVNGSNATFTTASQFQTNSLEVYKNGIRMKGGGADYTATAGGFTMVTAPATGTVLLVDYFIGGTINNIGTNSLITDEAPSGSINGSNTVFTAARPYIGGGLEVYLNGIKQIRGIDFTETTPTTGTFTLALAPLTGDLIRINYQYNLNPASNADTVDGYHANATPTANQLLVLDGNAMVPVAALGGAWASWTPTWGAISGGSNTLGNGTIDAAYIQIGKLVFLRVTLTWGTTTSSTGVDWSFSPPVLPKASAIGPPIGHTIASDTGVNDFISDCRLFSTTQIQPRAALATGSFVTNAPISSTSPFTWGNTDVLKFSGFYEAA